MQGGSLKAGWPVPAQTQEQPEIVPQQEHQQEIAAHQQPSQLPPAAATSSVLSSSPLPIGLGTAQTPSQEPAGSSANEEKEQEVLVAPKRRSSWLAYVTGADIAAHARGT